MRSLLSETLILSMVTATISRAVSTSHLFEGVRRWVEMRSKLFGKLFRCPYCFSHWVSFVLVTWTGLRVTSFGPAIDWILASFTIVYLALILNLLANFMEASE